MRLQMLLANDILLEPATATATVAAAAAAAEYVKATAKANALASAAAPHFSMLEVLPGHAGSFLRGLGRSTKLKGSRMSAVH